MCDTRTVKFTWDFGADEPESFPPGIFLTWIVRLLMFKSSSVFVALIRLGLFLPLVSSVTLPLGHVFCVSWTFLSIFSLLPENDFLCSLLENFWSRTSSVTFEWGLSFLSFWFFPDILCFSFANVLELIWIDQTKRVILSKGLTTWWVSARAEILLRLRAQFQPGRKTHTSFRKFTERRKRNRSACSRYFFTQAEKKMSNTFFQNPGWNSSCNRVLVLPVIH